MSLLLCSRSRCAARTLGLAAARALCLAALAVAVIAGALGPLGCQPLRAGVEGEGPDGPPDPGDEKPQGTLTVTPGMTSLTAGVTEQTLSLRATSSVHGDVTSLATWQLSDGGLGTIRAGKLTIPANVSRGGVFRIYASYKGVTGTAMLTLRVIAEDVLDPSAPTDAKDYFSGPGGGPPPSVGYPWSGTMMAPNVLQLRIQWTAGTGQTVFRITASGPSYERSFYVGGNTCPGGRCNFAIDDKLWSLLSHNSLGQDVTLTVAGSGSKGGQVGTSSPIALTFAPEDIRGGLYYFSPTIRGIKRVPLGASKPVDFIINGNDSNCAGCHAVSRDGKQVAVEFGSGDTMVGSSVVDGANGRMYNFRLTPGIRWTFSWFNPSGDKLLTNWEGSLKIRDPRNGAVLQDIKNTDIGGLGKASMPEWSPDGKYIAFVRWLQESPYDFELSNSGDIVVLPYNGGALGAPVTVVAGQAGREVHYWPSWSPDSRWLVFNSHQCPGTCQQYNAVETRLRLVRAIDDSGQPVANAAPLDLVAGTHEKHRSNNWPKFAPFLQNNRIVFVVYSATYGWGFQTGRQPQLYMFGLDLEKAKAGMDPSYQPVWLPFQEPSTGNHSAIWTTDVVCTTNTDCPGEFMCVNNMCVPRIG